MKKIIYIVIFLCNLSFAEESVIIPKELNSSFSNGTLYIYNGTVNDKNKKDSTLKVDTKNTDIRKVVVRNVRVNSQNSRIRNTGEQGAVVKINVDKKASFEAKNLRIRSANTRINNTSNASSGCAAVYCFKADSKSKVKSKNVTVTVTGKSKFTSNVK